MDDTIKRSDAIKAIVEYFSDSSDDSHWNAIATYIINGIPSAEKQSEWIFDDKGYFSCSECGSKPKDQSATSDFCPNCGCRMKGADNEHDK